MKTPGDDSEFGKPGERSENGENSSDGDERGDVRTRKERGLEESASDGEGGCDCGVNGPGGVPVAGGDNWPAGGLGEVGPPAYSVPSS